MSKKQGTTKDSTNCHLESAVDISESDKLRRLERALDTLLQAISDHEVDVGPFLPKAVCGAMRGAETALTETTGVTTEERVNARFGDAAR